jgi:Mrp family chromosome partitioning ATPase
MTTPRHRPDRRARQSANRQQKPIRPADPVVDGADSDGGLTLLDVAGVPVHVAPPAITECLRYMLARMRRAEGGELPERLGFTSAIRGEGVTFLARSLALVAASDTGRRVCLVDLNWWAQSSSLGYTATASGIAQVIQGTLALEDALVSTGNPNLCVLPAGPTAVSERPQLVHGPELEKILVVLSETFDHVILDLPAINATSESLTLAECSRALAFVVSHGVTPAEEARTALDHLSGVSVVGVILNRSSSKVPRFIRRRLPGV